jgi:hypothetical protein
MWWEDLLNVPWKQWGRTMTGADCAGVAELVNIKLGLLRSGELAFPRYTPTAAGLGFDEFMLAHVQRFEELGTELRFATQLGDVVVTDPSGNGMSAHLFTLVDLSPRTFLTALSKRGVRPVDAATVRNVQRVLRLRQ